MEGGVDGVRYFSLISSVIFYPESPLIYNYTFISLIVKICIHNTIISSTDVIVWKTSMANTLCFLSLVE